MKLQVNGRLHELDAALVPPEMPLLWALRDVLHLTGTKYGCGVGACGACTVLVDGQALRACVTPVGSIGTRAVQTIEGLAAADGRLHPVQQAWLEHQVPQCGYCQSGFILAVSALLRSQPQPTDAQIDQAIGNLCRCGSTPRMREAIHSAAQLLARSEAAPAGASGTAGPA